TLNIYVKKDEFENIPFPDRSGFLEKTGKLWCAQGRGLLPSVETRHIRTGERLGKYSCTFNQVTMPGEPRAILHTNGHLTSSSRITERFRRCCVQFGLQELVVILVIMFMLGIPVLAWWRIFKKSGNEPFLAIFMWLPFVNFIMLFWFAFTEWPI